MLNEALGHNWKQQRRRPVGWVGWVVLFFRRKEENDSTGQGGGRGGLQT